jgi:hypothetical protein
MEIYPKEGDVIEFFYTIRTPDEEVLDIAR